MKVPQGDVPATGRLAVTPLAFCFLYTPASPGGGVPTHTPSGCFGRPRAYFSNKIRRGLMSIWSVIGSRCLPPSWAPRVDAVVGLLLSRGHFVCSGGAVGTDLYVLRSLVRHGSAACQGSSVFLHGDLAGSFALRLLAGSLRTAGWSGGRGLCFFILFPPGLCLGAPHSQLLYRPRSRRGNRLRFGLFRRFLVHRVSGHPPPDARRGLPRRWFRSSSSFRRRSLGPLPFTGRGLSLHLFQERLRRAS